MDIHDRGARVEVVRRIGNSNIMNIEHSKENALSSEHASEYEVESAVAEDSNADCGSARAMPQVESNVGHTFNIAGMDGAEVVADTMMGVNKSEFSYAESGSHHCLEEEKVCAESENTKIKKNEVRGIGNTLDKNKHENDLAFDSFVETSAGVGVGSPVAWSDSYSVSVPVPGGRS